MRKVALCALLILCMYLFLTYDLAWYYMYYVNCVRFKKHLVTLEHNPNPLTKKWKVIFLYSHDFSQIPEYNRYSRALLMEYCNKHDCEFLERNHTGKDEISPYWIRVKDLIDLSESCDDNTLFIYLDLDTCINPLFMDKSIQEIIHSLDAKQEWNMYIGKDTTNTKYINTGVMMIKNTEWSRQMLRYWWSKYDRNAWNVRNGKWTCQAKGKKCAWARDNYEQGELENIYESDVLNAKANIAILHMDIVSNNFRTSKNSFIYHRMAKSNEDRTKFFKRLYENYQIT